MPCDYCNPDVMDFGFELPDQRAIYYLYGKTQHYEDCTAFGEAGKDCDCDEREVEKVITIVIDRMYRPCECGHGSDYDCRFIVRINGKEECFFDSEQKAETWVGIQYPKAEAPEADPDWESERWLRRAEGGY